MKRRLIVMRHAKSSWTSDAETDHGRPLKKRGRRDTPRVAGRLAELGWVPEFVLSSDSKRTRETAALLADEWPGETRCEFAKGLYRAGTEELIDEAHAVPDEVECLLVLGHNPGWEEVLFRLSGEDEQLTTANAALLEGAGHTWPEALAIRDSWKLLEVVRPKELPG